MNSKSDPNVQNLLDMLAVNSVLFAVGVFVIWLLIALLACVVAPDDRPWSFFWCTFLLLGPIGVALALLAQPRVETPAEG